MKTNEASLFDNNGVARDSLDNNCLLTEMSPTGLSDHKPPLAFNERTTTKTFGAKCIFGRNGID